MTELEAAAKAVVESLDGVYDPAYVEKCVKQNPDSLLGRTHQLKLVLIAAGVLPPLHPRRPEPKSLRKGG
jgi:hypothetical protein